MKKTLVLGASTKPDRYAYKAITMLQLHGHEVVAVGNAVGEVGNITIQQELPEQIDNLDTITLYLNPSRQVPYYDAIIGLQPKRVLFNPGTENSDLVNLCNENGIATEYACTLVLLSTSNY